MSLKYNPRGGTPGNFWRGCARPLLQILTRFQTKKRNFPHPFSKTLPYVVAHTYIAYIREYPPGTIPFEELNAHKTVRKPDVVVF